MRVPYPANPALSALRMHYDARTFDALELGYGTERTQLQWSEGLGGVTLDELSKYGEVEWFFSLGCFNLPEEMPVQVLWKQHHANKNPLSWGYVSPPWALYVQKNSTGGNRLVFNRRHAPIELRGRGANARHEELTFNEYVDIIPELKNDIEHAIVIQYKLVGDNTGFIRVWVDGVLKVERLNTPTTFLHDAFELDENGSWRSGFGSFNTLSWYQYYKDSTLLLDYYIRVVGYRQHEAGLTEETLRNAMLKLR